MYQIVFYEDKSGESEVADYIRKLSERRKSGKDEKIKFDKISAYMRKLMEDGLSIGYPYIKHLEGEIWELRPLSDRILFAYWCNNKFIILNQFVKKTRKTPRREIDKAKRLLNDYRERKDCDG